VINKHTNWKDEEKNDQENSKTTTMIATEDNVSDKHNNRMDKETNDPENSKTSTNIATEDQETSNCKRDEDKLSDKHSNRMDEVKNDHRKPRKRQHPEKITVRRMKAALNESTHQSDINIGEPQKKKKNLGTNPTANDDCIYLGTTQAKRRHGKLPCKVAPKYSKRCLLTALDNPRSWLADSHINHAQSLLQQQFPSYSGFQDVGVFQAADMSNSVIGTPEGKFIQILHVNSSHWITASNIGCPLGTVRVYDSLGFTKDWRLPYQLAWLLFHKGSQICIEYMNIQRQVGSNDCGLFSAAVATALCYQQCPVACHFDQQMMCQHLKSCFLNAKMTPFPLLKQRRVTNKVIKAITIPVYCHCRQPYLSKHASMAQCDSCHEWIHESCDTIPRVVFSKQTASFICSQCKQTL
jgi:hypothetical protein